MAPLVLSLLLGGMLLDGNLRLEGRSGPTVAGQPASTAWAAADLSIQGSPGPLVFGAGVAPEALIADSAGGPVQRLFCRAHVAAELRGEEIWRLELRQQVGYGVRDLSPLRGSPPPSPGPDTPPGVQLPPAISFVRVEESLTRALLDYALSRRVRFTGGVIWEVYGGADSASRDFLPLSRGPRLRARLSLQASRLDELDVDLFGFDTSYSNGRRATVAGATFSGQRTIARGARLLLGAGPAFGRAEDPITGTTQSFLPVAHAQTTLEPEALGERGLSINLRASVEPVGDQVYGILTERGGLRAGFGWRALSGMGLDGRLHGSVALTSDPSGTVVSGDRYAEGELRATWLATQRYDASVGVRGAWQSRPPVGLPPTQWGVFAAFGFHPFRH